MRGKGVGRVRPRTRPTTARPPAPPLRGDGCAGRDVGESVGTKLTPRCPSRVITAPAAEVGDWWGPRPVRQLPRIRSRSIARISCSPGSLSSTEATTCLTSLSSWPRSSNRAFTAVWTIFSCGRPSDRAGKRSLRVGSVRRLPSTRDGTPPAGQTRPIWGRPAALACGTRVVMGCASGVWHLASAYPGPVRAQLAIALGVLLLSGLLPGQRPRPRLPPPRPETCSCCLIETRRVPPQGAWR